MSAAPTDPVLSMKGIDKSFPGVDALKNVSLDLHEGEVLALLGENGAGKSTLIKMLGGAHRPDSGEVCIAGERVNLSSPSDSQAAGIAIIYQEFNLVPDLTVRENLFLGREETRRGLIRHKYEDTKAREIFARIGVDIDPDTLCRDLTVAEQQTVEIARALSTDARIIVMDEPTAALSRKEVDRLLNIVRDLKKQGIAIIYISHRLDEIFAVADRITVLRDGETAGHAKPADISKAELIELMVGRPLDEEFPSSESGIGPVRLRVEGLCRGRAVQDVSFDLHEGEILGLVGLVGAGRTETARLIFGAEKADSGRVLLDGKEISATSPRDAIRQGICLLTEDRKGQGLILIHNVRENFGLPNLKEFTRGGFLDHRSEGDALDHFISSLKIKLSGHHQATETLSGGNQQKVVLAKWLQRNADVFIFDEPTRGIDVGAKYEIYQLINELAAQGKSILLISSELPEVIGMSDRILVLHEGRVCGEITDVANTTQEQVLGMAIES